MTAVDAETLAKQAEALLTYVQSTITPGNQIMFAMDTAHTPVDGAPIVLAQAENKNGSVADPDLITMNRKPNYVIFNCQQVENRKDSDPTSANRSMDPATLIRILVGTERYPIDENAMNVRVLTGPAHGKLRAEIANTGYRFFAYDPNPGYFGKDQMVFLAELGGKLYKMVKTIEVVDRIDETEDQAVCKPDRVVKVSALPMQEIESGEVVEK